MGQKKNATDAPGITVLQAGTHPNPTSKAITLRPEQRKALEFLRGHTASTATVLVGEPLGGKSTLLDKLCAELRGCIIIRCSRPAGRASALLSALLRSAGLSPEGLTATEQRDLLIAFIAHQWCEGRKIVIAIDGAERLGEEAWQALETLHTLQLETGSALELIIVGQPTILRHFQSPLSGWHRVNTRVHVLQGPKATAVDFDIGAPLERTAELQQLIISLQSKVVDRVRLTPRTLIGRSAHNDVRLNHWGISRHHAVIVGTPQGYYIVDLNSKNGLFVNGKAVTSAVLRDGDVLSFGPYRIKLSAQGYRPLGDPRPAWPSLSRTGKLPSLAHPGASLREVR